MTSSETATEKKQYTRHPAAHASGGMILKDEDNAMMNAFKDMIAKLGKKLVKGEFHDLLKNPAPAYVHYPMSYLEAAANDMCFVPIFLKKAAEIYDPIERLKYVVANYISTQHINLQIVQCRAPLNPILGETCQRVLSTGDKFYGEQTSHHPPITHLSLEGPNREYEYSGFFEYKVWPSGINSLGGSRVGKQVISFQDGGLISVKDPELEISGMTIGERVHNFIGNAVIKDHVNMIDAEIIYNPPQETSSGLFGAISSKIWGGRQTTDTIQIQIYQMRHGKKDVLASGNGSWLSHLEFDGKCYWKLEDTYENWEVPSKYGIDEFFLPSDSSNRKDLQALKEKDYEKAEMYKVELEDLQRHDKKIRIAAASQKTAKSENKQL